MFTTETKFHEMYYLIPLWLAFVLSHLLPYCEGILLFSLGKLLSTKCLHFITFTAYISYAVDVILMPEILN